MPRVTRRGEASGGGLSRAPAALSAHSKLLAVELAQASGGGRESSAGVVGVPRWVRDHWPPTPRDSWDTMALSRALSLGFF